jgi:hypothetical protein
MTCVHLQQLYKLCQDQELKLSGSDLIHVVCTKCGVQEVCPSTLTDEHDAEYPEGEAMYESVSTAVHEEG